YGASKAAVAQFTRSLALHCCERDYAIRCNSVHPGQVRTPMHDKLIARVAREHGIDEEQAALAFLSKVPMKQWQEAMDIANGVLFLMSDEARYVTGTSMVIDGGMSLTN
ncbi:MAG: SDR family oxidoreductase, partial [Sphingobium sp.]